MKKSKRTFIRIASIACIVACSGDFLVLFLLGMQYPGYSRLKNTMSSMGITSSPVATPISLWWIFWGILIIFFALGLRTAFPWRKKAAHFASWLVILYGLGEGVGSGLFHADKIGTPMTWLGLAHNVAAGVGVASVMILPLAMVRIFPKSVFHRFWLFSVLVAIIGTIGVSMFYIASLWNAPDHFVSTYKGLWQRLFVLDYYTYLIAIAVKMLISKSERFK